MSEARKPRSLAQRDAQLDAMEAARGAAARRAEAKRRAAEREAADRSRVEFLPPRNPDRFMPIWKVRVLGADDELRSSREFYSASEAQTFADEQARFTRSGVVVFNWVTEQFEEKEWSA